MAVRVSEKVHAIEESNGDWFADHPLPELPADKDAQSSDSLTLVGLLVPEIGNRVNKLSEVMNSKLSLLLCHFWIKTGMACSVASSAQQAGFFVGDHVHGDRFQ